MGRWPAGRVEWMSHSRRSATTGLQLRGWLRHGAIGALMLGGTSACAAPHQAGREAPAAQTPATAPDAPPQQPAEGHALPAYRDPSSVESTVSFPTQAPAPEAVETRLSRLTHA